MIPVEPPNLVLLESTVNVRLSNVSPPTAASTVISNS